MADLDAEQKRALSRALERPTYELIPLAGADTRAALLPAGSRVSVTASPAQGMAATVDLARRLHHLGYEAVPHLSARLTRDRAELEGILETLDEEGIRKAFVVGGDVAEHGEFFDGGRLLEAMEDIGHGLDEIGVPGYPEGHHIVDDVTIGAALAAKAPHASYVTTQMCFSPSAIRGWVEGIRRDGIELPVVFGIPGAAELAKLLRISLRIGVGPSARFLSKNRSLAGKLARPGGYGPDALVAGLAPLFEDASAGAAGFHIYTFNQVESTLEWQEKMLSTL